MAASATSIIRRALEGTRHRAGGLVRVWLRTTPARRSRMRSTRVSPRRPRGRRRGERRVRALWRAFAARMAGRPALVARPHPYDEFVASLLASADAALDDAGVRFQRFEAALHAPVRVDFLALARLVGLGSPGPFGLLIHPQHGPWWALRGAWMVDARRRCSRAARGRAPGPCAGCPAPCVGGWANAGGIERATPEVRARCVVGQGSRYDDDQVAYHYERARRYRGAPCAADRSGELTFASRRPLERGLRVRRPEARHFEAELLRRLLEELRDRLGVDALARAAHPEARVVHLAAARLADAAKDALGPQRQRRAQPLLEHVLHRARQAQEHAARVRGARVARGAKNVAHVLVVEPGNDRRDHHADRSPARASRSMMRTRRAGVVTNGSMARAFASSQNGMLTVTDDARDARRAPGARRCRARPAPTW